MNEERDRTDQPLPGSVSNQNGEEAEPGHGGGPDAEPGQGGDGPADTKPSERSDDDRAKPSGGEAGEGSQSTGDPRSAG